MVCVRQGEKKHINEQTESLPSNAGNVCLVRDGGGPCHSQGDSGDVTDDEMVSRKTRSCKEGLGRNGPELSDSIDQDESGSTS